MTAHVIAKMLTFAGILILFNVYQMTFARAHIANYMIVYDVKAKNAISKCYCKKKTTL